MEQEQHDGATNAPMDPGGAGSPYGEVGESAVPREREEQAEHGAGERPVDGSDAGSAEEGPSPADPHAAEPPEWTTSAAAGVPADRHPVDEVPAAIAATAPEGAAHRGRVMADRVSVEQGAVGSAEGLNVDVVQGAIGLARGEQVTVTQGAIGVAVADDVRLHQSGAQLVLARNSVHVEQGGAATVVAQRVELGRGSFVGFLVAAQAEGETRAMFDWRGALAFGAAFAVVSAVLRGRRGRRSRG